jgi:hypothetical protein
MAIVRDVAQQVESAAMGGVSQGGGDFCTISHADAAEPHPVSPLTMLQRCRRHGNSKQPITELEGRGTAQPRNSKKPKAFSVGSACIRSTVRLYELGRGQPLAGEGA